MMKITKAKPFLKWAGGKTQLIAEIDKNLPREILEDKFTYVEPFIGSGAVMFWMISNFPKMEKAVINDINADLINTYEIVRSKPHELISILKHFQNEFHALQTDEEKGKSIITRKEIYTIREILKINFKGVFILS
ncbi:MAG TPA: DNA adenine methylase [Pyrinomonadaceae bacterium]|nr:DNA adenine methylase [Pyrinomonadaceae bacterium]